jgi:hypothetical protein
LYHIMTDNARKNFTEFAQKNKIYS